MNLRALIPGRITRLAARRHSGAPRASRRRRAARAVGTAAVVYSVVHLALAAAPAFTFLASDPIYADKERRLRRVEAAAPPGTPRVVLLGTSRGGNAFAAGRAEAGARAADTPVVAFNYGAIGAGPITYRVYFERLLADGHRPDLLLVEVLPPLLADVPGGPPELQLSGDLLTRAEVEGAVAAGMPAGRLRDQWRGSVTSPVFAHRFKLMGRLLPSVVPWQMRYDWGRTPDPNGWNAVPFDAPTDEDRARGEAWAAATYRSVLQLPLPAGPAAAALRDLLARCRAEGVAAALVVCPEGSSFRALYPPHVGPRLARFFADLTAEFGCPVIDARLWVEDRHFVDGHHLMRSGAIPFTDRLTAEAIVPLLRERGRP